MTLDWDAPVGYAHATRLVNLPTKEVTVTYATYAIYSTWDDHLIDIARGDRDLENKTWWREAGSYRIEKR